MLHWLAPVVLLCPIAAQTPGELLLPRGARLGVACSKASFLELEMCAQLESLAPQRGLRAEIAWLGVWPKEALARALVLDLDQVVLVREAKSANVMATRLV
jgi:hypothetical protein